MIRFCRQCAARTHGPHMSSPYAHVKVAENLSSPSGWLCLSSLRLGTDLDQQNQCCGPAVLVLPALPFTSGPLVILPSYQSSSRLWRPSFFLKLLFSPVCVPLANLFLLWHRKFMAEDWGKGIQTSRVKWANTMDILGRTGWNELLSRLLRIVFFELSHVMEATAWALQLM